MKLNKKQIIIACGTITPLLLPVISSSCHWGSFYNTKKVYEANYVKDLKEAYNNYLASYNKMYAFVSTPDDYKKFYYQNYLYVNEASIKWNELFKELDKYLNAGKDNKPEHEILLGYKNSLNEFVKMNNDDYLDNNPINLYEELKPNSKNPNIRTQIKFITSLNNEINSILNDYINELADQNRSPYYDFLKIFNLYEQWPLFENSKNVKELKALFAEDLRQQYKQLQINYNRKYYDPSRINIDYNNLTTSNPEDANYHTHAIYNLWQEWNTIIIPHDSREKNRLQKVADFFETIYKTNEKVKSKYNSEIWIKVGDSFFKSFDELFMPSIKVLFKNEKTFELKVTYNVENNPAVFGDFWKDRLNNLVLKAKNIVDVVDEYNE